MQITLIGTGHVANHLAQRWHEKGLKLAEIVGRSPEKVTALAQKYGAKPVFNSADINPDSSVYVIAVSDAAIPSVAEQLSLVAPKGVVVHTSGATAAAVLAPFFDNFGSFYPLQTFSVGRQPDFNTIPLCINANSAAALSVLKILGAHTTERVLELADADRITLHVAAVFVNNFVNHLYYIGQDILGQKGWPLDILLPLMQETLDKVRGLSPQDSQTGPAIRGDQNTVNRHLAYLESHTPQYAPIYRLLSQSINQHINFE